MELKFSLLISCLKISAWIQEQHKAARTAEERYRNELEAHAGAITALRHAEDSQDVSISCFLIDWSGFGEHPFNEVL